MGKKKKRDMGKRIDGGNIEEETGKRRILACFSFGRFFWSLWAKIVSERRFGFSSCLLTTLTHRSNTDELKRCVTVWKTHYALVK